MCTGLFLQHANRGFVYARTLEFGKDLQSQVLFIPRQVQLTAISPDVQQSGLQWKAQYAAVGANAFGLTDLVDGVNEHGLAGGLFYFPGYAEYQDVLPASYARSIPMWQLLTWILTTCTNVDEVKKTLPTVVVSNACIPGTVDGIPAHLIVHDSSGASIVIEYVKKQLHIYDNPLGIITNAPTFDWHMTNLRNYINLSPYNAADTTISGVTLSPLGQGSGMLGIPGDFTSPSRFIRIAAYTQATPPLHDEPEAISQAFHILHNFDIPKGCVRDHNGIVEYTLWTSAIDLKHKTFYFKTYDNLQIHKLDLMQMDLTAQSCRLFPMVYQETINSIL
jgi:choloylglycine hydrolase